MRLASTLVRFFALPALLALAAPAHADPADLGFYVQGPGGTHYSQDARNADGARILAFNGTGTRTGYTWFACETGPGPGGDYADAIYLVQLALAPTQARQTHWGRLKALFR